MTVLVEFRTDVKAGKYTRCKLGHIVGSDRCRACSYFVGKLVENEKEGGRYTLVSKGVVECRLTI